MLKMVDGTGIIGVDMVCPLGGTVSPPQPPNYDNIEMEGVGSLMLPNSLKAPLERAELIGNSMQGENPAPDNPQEIKSAGKWNEASRKYLLDVKVTGKNLLDKSIILPLSSYDIKDGIYWRKYFYLLPNTDYLIRVTPHYTEKLVDTSGFLGVGEPYDNNLPNGIISLIPDVGTTDKTNYFRTDATGKVILKFKDSANEENIRKMLEQVEITLALKTFNNEHEPYTEQTVQIALDEPLRGIGEYKDVLTKDGVVRKIYPPYEINLNDLRDGGYSKTNTVMFSVKVQNKTVGYASSKPSILCNILPDCALQMSNIYNNDKECIAVGGGIVLFRVNKSRLKDISSFEATKQSFIELMADKKMIVEYALETPVTELLPESVQQKLQALHSENGTTHVFVDSGEVPCGIKLTYRKEK